MPQRASAAPFAACGTALAALAAGVAATLPAPARAEAPGAAAAGAHATIVAPLDLAAVGRAAQASTPGAPSAGETPRLSVQSQTIPGEPAASPWRALILVFE